MTTTVKKKNNFDQLWVGSLETRKATEMSQLIENFKGRAFVAPSLREVPLEKNKDTLEFGDKLMKGQIHVLILLTGVGTRALLKTLLTRFSEKDLKSALNQVTLLTRGPKPVQALDEFGLTSDLRVPEPNTWREILKILDQKSPVENKTVAVQEYGEPHKLLLAELKARGANVLSVSVYRADLPEDTSPMVELIEKVISGDISVLLFTNSTQVAHLMAVARQKGLAQQLREALVHRVVGSVGPSCTDTLLSYGLPVDLEPKRPMMGALVTLAAEEAPKRLKQKKEKGPSLSVLPKGLSHPGDPAHQSLFLKACRREPVPRTPIWLMRQAGRYMKEYRELRAKVSFLELCKNSDLASEVTVDAAHRLDVDAAIIFSDILIILEPLGFDLTYEKNEGPEIGNPFRDPEDLKRLKDVDVLDSMRFVFDAIRKTRKSLKPDIPLIGFAGAPFTLASYLIEGGTSRQFLKTKTLMLQEPKTWHALLERITTALIDYVNEQVKAGAQAIQIFDSWAGCLNPEDYRTFVFPYTKRLIQHVTPGIPVISFGTQTAGLLPLMKQAGGDVIGVDWRIELDEAWGLLDNVAIMGNLDPAVLLSTRKDIRLRAERILTQAGQRPGHIFNLGHGVLPATPLDHVLYLIETVKELSQK